MGRKRNKKIISDSEALYIKEKPSLKSMLLLVFIALCWHGFILTNDGTYWDSWFVKEWLKDKDWNVINAFFGSVGMPVYAWIYMPFAFFSNIIEAFMIATVSCLAFQSILIYLLCFKLGALSEKESLCLSVLAISIPIFTAGQDFIMFFFIFTYTLFLAAAYISVLSFEKSGWKAILIRITAILIFFLSFYNAALLVFYGGFYLLFFFNWWRKNPGDFLDSIFRFSLRYLDFLILPPVAWGFRHFFTPQFGWYADYNSPTANIPFILPSIKSFFINVPTFHANQVWFWINDNPIIIFVLSIGIFFAVIALPAKYQVNCSKAKTTYMIGFGILLLFFAIFPFAAAGKGYSPQPIGEPSRYTILTGLPIAILIFSSIRLIFCKHDKYSRWPMPICFGIAVVLGCQITPVYIAERVEWVYSRSILHNIKNIDEIKKSSVVIMQNCGMTSEIIYGIYAFKSIFGEISRLVTPIPPQNGLYFIPSEILMQLQRTTMLPNLLHDIDPSGQQILVYVERSRNIGNLETVIKYLSLCWSGKKEELGYFLSSLTNIKTRVLKTCTSIECNIDRSTVNPSPNEYVNCLGIDMVKIPGENILVARNEISQEQFTKLMGWNPSIFKDPNRPVERVSWHQAVDFCNLLNAEEKKTGRIPEGLVYRLPSIAEFQKYSLNALNDNDVLAGETIFWSTQPVASKMPNSFGLCDTIGNVWEWTADWGDKLKKMKASVGGSFTNFPNELKLHPQRDETMDFFSRAMVRRYFGPTRLDHPDQSSWDRGFRIILAKPIEN